MIVAPSANYPTGLVELRHIELDKRFNLRKRYEDLTWLMADLQRHGLLHPIVVAPLPDGRYTLVSGFRRYLAAERLGWESIRVTIRADLKESEKLEINVTENLHRSEVDFFDLSARMAMLRDTHRAAVDTLAKRLGMPKDRARRLLYIHDHLELPVRESMLQSGLKLNLTEVHEIATAEPPDQWQKWLDLMGVKDRDIAELNARLKSALAEPKPPRRPAPKSGKRMSSTDIWYAAVEIEQRARQMSGLLRDGCAFLGQRESDYGTQVAAVDLVLKYLLGSLTKAPIVVRGAPKPAVQGAPSPRASYEARPLPTAPEPKRLRLRLR